MEALSPSKAPADAEHVESDAKFEHNAAIVRSTGARSMAFAEALALENPRPFRKSFLKLYLCLFVAYMCSSTNGFDANTFGKSCSIGLFNLRLLPSQRSMFELDRFEGSACREHVLIFVSRWSFRRA